ncbi:MAG: hypothetical protein PVF19_06715, partial [Gemmatimonadota bacterium]
PAGGPNNWTLARSGRKVMEELPPAEVPIPIASVSESKATMTSPPKPIRLSSGRSAKDPQSVKARQTPAAKHMDNT